MTLLIIKCSGVGQLLQAPEALMDYLREVSPSRVQRRWQLSRLPACCDNETLLSPCLARPVFDKARLLSLTLCFSI